MPQIPLTIADTAKISFPRGPRIPVHPMTKLSQIFHAAALPPIPRKGVVGCSCVRKEGSQMLT